MSVIETLGPFTLHGVGQHKNWIKWQSGLDDLWMQYNLVYVAFHVALVNSITLRWQARPGKSSYSHTFTKEWWDDVILKSDQMYVYADAIKHQRDQCSDKLGWNYVLERCELPNEEDAIAMLDELNCAWVYQQLKYSVYDT